MKSIIQNIKSRLLIGVTSTCCILLISGSVQAQTDSVEAPVVKTVKIKPVKNTFASTFIIDNQSVMVPVKGAYEMEIQHRFGTINNGYDDFWGLFAPSNIRLGVQYSPIKNLRRREPKRGKNV